MIEGAKKSGNSAAVVVIQPSGQNTPTECICGCCGSLSLTPLRTVWGRPPQEEDSKASGTSVLVPRAY